MFLRALTLGLALGLAAPVAQAGDGHAHSHGTDHHKTEVAGIAIVHGWARATRSGETQVFLELRNGTGGEVTLTGAHVPGSAARAQVMGAPLKAGGDPVALGAFAVAAGLEFELDPEGVYLHLSGLDAALEQGTTLPLVLELDPVGEVEIVIDVEAANARQHSHAGHDH